MTTTGSSPHGHRNAPALGDRSPVATAAFGAVVGLAWATSLRGWMLNLALGFGDRPRVTWEGTFLAVLLPATILGVLIGLDWHRRAHGNRRVPGAVWSPLLLAIAPAIVADDFLATLLETGEGSGAIGVVAIGMCGGVAIAGRGRAWPRALAGVVAGGVTAAMVYVLSFPGSSVTAASAYGGVHLLVLMFWFAVACSLPMRPGTAIAPAESQTAPTTTPA